MILPTTEFWLSILAQVSFFFLVAETLNLQYGFTGIPNFGVILGVGGGGLAAAIVGRILPQWILAIKGDPLIDNVGISTKINDHFMHDPALAIGILLITLVAAGVVGCLMGMFASLPAIRLKADYLAIMLFVLGYLVQIVGINDYDIAGGSNGVFLPDPFVSLGVSRFLVVSLITLGVAAFFFVYMRKLIRSPLGRSLRAIRDNEVTAQAVGRNLPISRLRVMGVGAAVAGLTGGLYAYYSLGVSGGTFNTVDWSFYIWLILILGGVGSNLGVLLATTVLITAREFVVLYEPYFEAYVPFNVVYLEYLAVGMLLIFIMIYRPGGILPEKSGITLRSKPKEEGP